MASSSCLSHGQSYSSILTWCTVPSSIPKVNPTKLHSLCFSRRMGSIAVMGSLLLATDAILSTKTAEGFEFRMTVPDQTVEEAESVIKDHAQALLDVKFLLESESWRDAQEELRKNAAYLKQDIYTIIQSKEGTVRPLLRKLYSKLFINVGKLDYAARDKDVNQVQEYYDIVVSALDDILARI